MSLTFPKSVHLTHRSEFLQVKAQGRAHAGRYMTLGVLPGRPASKVGLITSKRVGGAVERNRVRRRLRELMRLTRPAWKSGIWIVAIARRAAVTASFDQLQAEWLRLAIRAGLLPAAAPKPPAGEGKAEPPPPPGGTAP
ncbi:MAG: ribonuclease P protein component [Chthoniobacteraceae bacterium]|nr:ribonuclease P protein component [Chthoniobacteraceae bacterium]